MVSENWKNKWVLMLLIAIIIQAVMYPAIWFLQPAAFTAHNYFLEVIILCMGSVIMQTIGFGVIMSKTKGMDPVLYGQGRPFRHKLREEDEEEGTRKDTFN